MTLNAKIEVFMDFLAIFGCETTFQAQIAPRSIEIDMEKLRMKFSALNVDFDVSIFWVQGNLRKRVSKSGTPVKVVILSLLASFSENSCR